jgi:hypothetical protein
MTSSPNQSAPKNKRPKFIYRGPNSRANNVIFELLESPDREGDEWKNSGEKEIYLWSLDRYVQPDNVKDKFCDYTMGNLDEDVIVNAYLPKVDLSKKMGESGEADSIAGGFVCIESEENFKKYYHQIGQK